MAQLVKVSVDDGRLGTDYARDASSCPQRAAERQARDPHAAGSRPQLALEGLAPDKLLPDRRPATWPPGADRWLVFEADHTRSLLFMVDGGLPVARAQTEHPLGTPVGHHERGWQLPGQSGLWLYTFRCQIKPFSTSDDADALVMHRGADPGHGSATA